MEAGDTEKFFWLSGTFSGRFPRTFYPSRVQVKFKGKQTNKQKKPVFILFLGLKDFGGFMIFSINTTRDISKLLYVISQAVRQVKFETILKYHEWYLCQISRTNHAIICLYYYPQKVVIFTRRYFKLS